ncbi:MAG: metal ABC transporter ATP-binding protein [Clostridia bacterium]|nr:metal ABC transporter ATP-binding protein [Clostridia bacterium]
MAGYRQCTLCRIDLKNVSVTRAGQEVLRDVNMHIHCGQLTAVIGQNGAGKTTLVRALLGEIPYGGTIRHEDGHGHPFPRLRTGYVPQHLQFDKEMPVTVEDFMAAALSRRPVWTGIGRKTRKTIEEALSVVKGEDLLRTPLGRCSGGELQRVLLALALTPNPDLLVLDEPVSGVDQNGLNLFLDTVMELKHTRHMAILLVSHDLNLVRDYADHVVLLEKTVLRQGTPGLVFASEVFRDVFGDMTFGDKKLLFEDEPLNKSVHVHGESHADPCCAQEEGEQA